MYHCHIQIYFVGGQRGIFEIIRGMRPLEHFKHTFVESAKPKEGLLAQSDLILADVQGMKSAETLSVLRSNRKAGAELILLSSGELTKVLVDTPSEIRDIWTLPMSESEVRFRFVRWQQAYKRNRDLWQANYFLDTCINSSPNLVWYKDRDGVHEKVNDSFCNAAKKRRDQVEGKKESQIWNMCQEDPVRLLEEQELIETGTTCVYNEVMRTADGELQLTTYKSPLYDLDGRFMGTVGVGIDVTKDQAYEQEITEKERTLEMLASTEEKWAKRDREFRYQEQLFEIFSAFLSDNVNDVYIMMDEAGERVEFVSPNIERVLGVSEQAILRNVEQIGDAEYIVGNAVTHEELAALTPGAALETMETERIHRKTGERKWFRESVHCVSVEGAKKIIAYISDRTQERTTQNALSEALEMAQVASKAKSTFLSNVSHDIRTPMNAIMGFITLLQEEANDPERVQEYTQKISAASQHLLGLINDVLDMTKIESGNAVLNISELNIAEIIEEINTIIRPQAKAKDQSFEIYTNSLTQEHLLGDKLRINQILINILSNAVKYTGDGGNITMRIRELSQVDPNYSRIQFTVTDNGQGMSEEYQRMIFDPFTREYNTAWEKIQGTGLGMAITKSLVDLMGGSIKVASKLGVGSTFTVELELRIQEKEEDRGFWERYGVSRMVVADDDENICRDIKKKMAETGVEVEFATHGARAVEMIQDARTSGKPYDLIMLDWKMPDLDGLATARLIRQNALDKTPILLFTAYDWEEIEGEAMEVGIKHFLPKPFFMSNFKSAIQRMAEEEKKAAAPAQKGTKGTSVLSGKHILVVDDIDVNRIILMKILSTLGATCDTAEDGQKALEKFTQSEPGTYDLIFMDIQMPIMNGFEATMAIRNSSHPTAKSVPIIAVTANAFVDDVRESLKSGMDAHVAKPIALNQLEQTVSEVLEKKREKE